MTVPNPLLVPVKEPTLKLTPADFYNCCGIKILYGLNRFAPADNGKKQLLEYLNWSKNSKALQGAGLNLIAINNDQEAKFGKTLIEGGYTRIVNGSQNGMHNSLIYVYAYVYRPEHSNPNCLGSQDNLDY